LTKTFLKKIIRKKTKRKVKGKKRNHVFKGKKKQCGETM
jgi:hypothetical protein